MIAEDLDILLPSGWSEQAFRTSTKCVVCWQQPMSIRCANQRKLHYKHSECPHCQWSRDGKKPALCQSRKTWPVDLSYLFMTFSRERSHQEQTKEGKLSFLLLLTMYLMIFITSSHIYYIDCIVSNSWAFIWSTEKIDLSWISSSSEEEWSSTSLPNIFKIVFDQLQSSVFPLSFTISQGVNSCWPENWNYGRKLYLLSVNT